MGKHYLDVTSEDVTTDNYKSVYTSDYGERGNDTEVDTTDCLGRDCSCTKPEEDIIHKTVEKELAILLSC